MEPDGLQELRAEYLQQVIAALAEYSAGGGAVTLESSREGDEVTLVFKLAGGEAYQALVEQLTSSGLGRPDAAS